MTRKFTIHVPASTANIGPGFDVLGIGLSLHLILKVEVHNPPSSTTTGSLSNTITIDCEGYGSDSVSRQAKDNLITSTAMFVAKSNGKTLPFMHIHCMNNIPLGSGLGSSGTAVVAGVCLANEACELGLDRDRLLDYCLFIEGHPDNVAPSLLGGFVAAYMRELPYGEEGQALEEQNHHHGDEQQKNAKNIPVGIGRYISLEISHDIKAVVVTPHFQVATKMARQVLPPHYTRKDVVFNLQRLAVLTNSLGEITKDSNPRQKSIVNGCGPASLKRKVDRFMIYEAIKDTIHQPYRKHLIPGLTDIFDELEPAKYEGLLGVCISGAGPTVLALAIDGFYKIGDAMKVCFTKAKKGPQGDITGIQSDVRVLDVDRHGVRVEYH